MTARVIRLDDAVRRVTHWRNIVMIREPGKTRLFCVCALVEQTDPGVASHADPLVGRGAVAMVRTQSHATDGWPRLEPRCSSA